MAVEIQKEPNMYVKNNKATIGLNQGLETCHLPCMLRHMY